MRWLPSPLPGSTFKPVQLYVLGRYDLLINGVLQRFDGRGPRKPLALLGLLAAAGPHGACTTAIADALWPEADGFDAYRALITTLHRLRRLLVHRSAIYCGAGRLRLDPATCAVDLWDFEQALAGARDRLALQAALALSAGPFLEEEDGPWAIGVRARLEQSVARKTRQLWSAPSTSRVASNNGAYCAGVGQAIAVGAI